MNIIGCMWARNEGDLIAQTIEAALNHPDIDGLFVADDDSTDNTWDVIQAYKSKLIDCYRRQDHRDKDKYTEHIWARQFLMDEVRRRYGKEDTWIQIVESDIMIFDTNIKEMIEKIAVKDCLVYWQTLNACRRDWNIGDDWPNWNKPINEVMPDCHWMEVMPYTYRPLDKIYYDPGPRKPWPRGFTNYGVTMRKSKTPTSPLLMHYGLRGPTYYYHKMKDIAMNSNKYPEWSNKTLEDVKNTISFFNGEWNNHPTDTFPQSRDAWIKWCEYRAAYLKWRNWLDENSKR